MLSGLVLGVGCRMLGVGRLVFAFGRRVFGVRCRFLGLGSFVWVLDLGSLVLGHGSWVLGFGSSRVQFSRIPLKYCIQNHLAIHRHSACVPRREPLYSFMRSILTKLRIQVVSPELSFESTSGVFCQKISQVVLQMLHCIFSPHIELWPPWL